MRRLLNFCLLLVVLGAVGFILFQAKLLPFGRSTPSPVPTKAPTVARDSLRISVAQRPELLMVQALKRLVEVENRKIEILPFNPETSWLELAAGELDLVIAPIGEAVTAQARFQPGRFLFLSGLSEGYDVIVSKSALGGSPKTLGVSGADGSQLFALQQFPDARLVNAPNQRALQDWLLQGAVQAAVLESASLDQALSQNGNRLSATSVDNPMPTVVVLSRALAEETEATAGRTQVLLAALESWEGLVGYLDSQPELLRSTLKSEADDLGVNLDTLLKDYRFLSPKDGRAALLQGFEGGLLKETLDLLVLARITNLTAPDWSTVLTLSPKLETALQGRLGASAGLPTPAPVVGQTPVTPIATLSPTPLASATPTSGILATHHFAGKAPSDPWPEPTGKTTAGKALPFAPALTDSLVGVATENGFSAYGADGKAAFLAPEGGAPVAAPLADEQNFFIMRSGQLSAVDSAGKELWKFAFEGTPGSEFLLSDKQVIFTLSGAAEHRILAVSKSAGTAVWEAAVPAPPASAPVLASGTPNRVLLVDESGNLHAWQADTGAVLWQSSIGQKTFLAPAARGDALAVIGSSGTVRLVSLTDGSKVWETDLATALAGTPTLTDSMVLVPAKDTYLYALDLRNGGIAGKTRLSVPLSSAPIVVGDHVYQGDEMGGVHSLTLPGLTLNWSKSLLNGNISGPAFADTMWAILGSDGELLIYAR